MSLNNLANAVMTRFNLDGQREDLDECIIFNREALAIYPAWHPDRSISLNNLAAAVMTRFEQDGKREDLNECIMLNREALALYPEGHSNRSVSLNNLAAAVLTCFKQDSKSEDLEESVKLLEEAASHQFSSLLIRLKVAIDWTNVARSQGHCTTLKAYETTLSLLQRALTISPTLRRQHDLLVGEYSYPTLAMDAASYAIERCDIPKAVEMLEQGRGLLWSQMRGFRTPLDSLAKVNKPLADKFKDINRRLEELSISPEKYFTIPPDFAGIGGIQASPHKIDNQLKVKRQLSEDQDKMMKEIRGVNGFKDFLKATPFDKLQQSADEGPVIIINHSKYRSDAIILYREHEPILVPLSQLALIKSESEVGPSKFYEDVLGQSERLSAAREYLQGEPEHYDNVLVSVLKWLWENVGMHVVAKLRELKLKKLPRIWWCPTSVFTSLPLHAMGPYYFDGDDTPKYILDEYVSSYTPTISALIDARISVPTQHPALLAIGCRGRPPNVIENVSKEIDIVRNWKNSTNGVLEMTLLEENDATKAAVVESLGISSWVHFACHGHLNAGDPFDSSFELYNNERLTLLKIVENQNPNAELAFLSACHSAAQADGRTHDEVIHLAAAIQFCGFRSVIGTMWEVCDKDGPVVSEAFYKELVREGKKRKYEQGSKKSARALRNATVDLRGMKVRFERWVNFIHIGA